MSTGNTVRNRNSPKKAPKIKSEKGWQNHERVKELLEEQGRTRKWLAEKCEVTRGSLNQIISGYRRPSKRVKKLMALAFDISITEFEDPGEPLNNKGTRN